MLILEQVREDPVARAERTRELREKLQALDHQLEGCEAGQNPALEARLNALQERLLIYGG
ncbi:MAG: hypothetical protein AAFY60_06010 [Myxococcota bacterium]